MTLGGLKCSLWDLLILTRNSEFTPRLILSIESNYYNFFGYYVDLVLKSAATVYFSFTGFSPFPFVLPVSNLQNLASESRLFFQYCNTVPHKINNFSIEQTSLFYVGVAQVFSDLF